jgi:hypothetical protein
LEFLFNDLSIHGQFFEIATFRETIGRIMEMRQLMKKFGHQLFCHRNIMNAKVIRDESILQIIQRLSVNDRRALMQWLTQQGPFWEDVQEHCSDDYMESKAIIVTDTALGEAAYCCFQGINRRLLSLSPSSWEFTPIPVIWSLSDDEKRNIAVDNYWTINQLQLVLQNAPASVTTWDQLSEIAQKRFDHLTFSKDCFAPFRGVPFNEGAAQRLLILMKILDQSKCCFDENGKRNSEGHRIYQNHFTGEKTPFTDSSDSEKQEFKKELTFPHPERKNETLFCPWHGKVKSPQFRVHFSWPISANEPLYVVYVGPKITKR